MNDTQTETKPSAYRWIVFSLLAFGYLLVYFHRLCPAVVALDMMDDLKAGAGLMGLLASAYFYPYAFMQIPSGLLTDSWGPRKTITLFFIIAGLSSIGLGLAQTTGWAIVTRAMVGFGVAMLFVPSMKILTRWFKASEFAFMTGLLMAVGGLGALSAAKPLAWASGFIGWRGSFTVIGVVTLVTSVAIWILVRNTPEELGYPAIEPSGKQNTASPAFTLSQGVKLVLGSARFRPLAVWFFFTFGIFFSFGGLWGGPYLMEVHHLGKQQAGSILSMLAVAMIFGGPLYSYLSDRVFHSRKIVLVLSSLVVTILVIPLVYCPIEFQPGWLFLWFLLLGFFASAVVVIGFTTAKESFPVEIAGTSVGLINIFPFLGGAIVQPAIGLVLDAYGKGLEGYPPEAYRSAFSIYLVSAVIAFVASCFIKETYSTPKS